MKRHTIQSGSCTFTNGALRFIFTGSFVITFEYVSKNGTGTGEIDLGIDTVDHLPVGEYISYYS